MFKFVTIVLIGILSATNLMAQEEKKDIKLNKLNDFEKYVIVNKGTERPFTGE